MQLGLVVSEIALITVPLGFGYVLYKLLGAHHAALMWQRRIASRLCEWCLARLCERSFVTYRLQVRDTEDVLLGFMQSFE